jgi:hypothetical protein
LIKKRGLPSEAENKVTSKTINKITVNPPPTAPLAAPAITDVIGI